MIKPDLYRITEQRHTTDVPDTVKLYSHLVKGIMKAVWKLLLLNLVILLITSSVILFSDIQGPGGLRVTHLLLTLLIIYFVAFPCIKVLIHLLVLCACRMHLDSSKMQLAGVICEPSYDAYIKRPLQKIRILFRIYPMVMLIHLSMAFICYYLKYYLLP